MMATFGRLTAMPISKILIGMCRFPEMVTIEKYILQAMEESKGLKKIIYSPLEGNLQAVTGCDDESCTIYIAGDPKGLRSLAQLLIELAEVDQRQLPSLPETGASEHIHLGPDSHLGENSFPMVISRLDDKHGVLDETFQKAKNQTINPFVHLW